MKNTLISMWNRLVSVFHKKVDIVPTPLSNSIVSLYDTIKNKKEVLLKLNAGLGVRLKRSGTFNYATAHAGISALTGLSLRIAAGQLSGYNDTHKLEVPKLLTLDEYLTFSNRNIMSLSEYFDSVIVQLTPIVDKYNDASVAMRQHYDRVLRPMTSDIYQVVSSLDQAR